MNHYTGAPKGRAGRPRTTVELVDSIVDCDRRTRRTVTIISALTVAVAIVVLAAAVLLMTAG